MFIIPTHSSHCRQNQRLWYYKEIYVRYSDAREASIPPFHFSREGVSPLLGALLLRRASSRAPAPTLAGDGLGRVPVVSWRCVQNRNSGPTPYFLILIDGTASLPLLLHCTRIHPVTNAFQYNTVVLKLLSWCCCTPKISQEK